MSADHGAARLLTAPRNVTSFVENWLASCARTVGLVGGRTAGKRAERAERAGVRAIHNNDRAVQTIEAGGQLITFHTHGLTSCYSHAVFGSRFVLADTHVLPQRP